MKIFLLAVGFAVLGALALFGYPLYCLLRRYWAWGRLWRGPSWR